MSVFPTPHFDKLNALLLNDKVPNADKPRIRKFIERYKTWITALDGIRARNDERLRQMVGLLNGYRNAVDIDLIFDSEQDFLYRQKGQLKLDNSVIEEFLPRLIDPELVPELKPLGVSVGPASSFLSVYFTSALNQLAPGGGLSIRAKDQDFAVSKPLYVQSSYTKDFKVGSSEVRQTSLAYIAAECKTNLDKTMFQEACATARDTKLAVPGARYYLLCEWLDMTPVSTATTPIDEVIILRMAKRLASGVRQYFSEAAQRRQKREEYISFLGENPFRPEMFSRLLGHIKSLVSDKQPEEQAVLKQGYF
jgi:Bpu10I-like restriction endonuclease